MALFTRENAAEYARRSHSPNSARHLQPQPAPVSIASAEKTAEERRRQTLAQQIDLLDNLIARTNGGGKVLQYINAKAKLWELLYPKPGSLRPKAGRVERAPVAPMTAPIPALVVSPSPVSTDAPPQIAVSNPSENHNDASA